MKYSISVTTYNRKALSEVCILSILKNTPNREDYELVVVDNCSDDGTQEMLKEMKNEGKIDKLFINNWNKHLGVSTNQAFDLADKGADWLINLSCDHYAVPGWFDNFLSSIEWHFDYIYTVLRPGTCNVPRETFLAGKAHLLKPHREVQIGGGLAIRQETLKKTGIRFQERWTGAIGSIYSVIHAEFQQHGLRGIELAKPCILVQNCEFNNPLYADYYHKFFNDRNTLDRLDRMKAANGYMTEQEIEEYYAGSGYSFHSGAEANAAALR
jgi:glycosyltransferase involved in cell wall biosynthesis